MYSRDTLSDRLIPTTINPVIFPGDNYQTYDLVLVERVAQIFNEFQFPPNFPKASGKRTEFLFDRYVPQEAPWCDRYSAKIANFWHRYSGNDFGDSVPAALSPVSNLFDPDWAEENRGLGFAEFVRNLQPLKVKYAKLDPNVNYKTKYDWSVPAYVNFELASNPNFNGTITYLSWEEDSNTASRRILRFNPKLPKRINIKAADFIPCSLVVSGTPEFVGVIEGALQAFSYAYLYKNLEAMLEDIAEMCDKMPLNQIEIGSEFTYANSTSLTAYQTLDNRSAPSWYQAGFASLFVADNSYWKNEIDKPSILPHPVYFYIPAEDRNIEFTMLPRFREKIRQSYYQLIPKELADVDYEMVWHGETLAYVAPRTDFIEQTHHSIESGSSGANQTYWIGTNQAIMLSQFRDENLIHGISGLFFCARFLHFDYGGMPPPPIQGYRKRGWAEKYDLFETIEIDVHGSFTSRNVGLIPTRIEQLRVEFKSDLEDGDALPANSDVEAVAVGIHVAAIRYIKAVEDYLANK